MSGTLTIAFKRFLLLTASIFISQLVLAQSNRSQTIDHLQYGKQTDIKPKENEIKKDTSKSDGYFIKCVENATLKNNSNNSATSNEKVKYAAEKKKLAYADSLILVANKSNNNSLIGSAYLSKGIIYYEFQNYGKAFDYFIKADNYISRTDNEDLTNKVKYNIALIKYQLGYYDESISFLRETIDYFEKSDDEFYLKSLYSIGLCYIKNGSYAKCSQINQTGINEAKKLNNRIMEPYFILSDGINEYFKHNYTSAVSKLESSVNHFKNSDFKNESLASFYIGKSYLALNRKETALPYFLNVDKIFDDKDYMTLELREVYKLLIEYYREKDDPVSQLHYVDQFLKADKLTNINYNHLSRRISRQYDAKQLILEQQKLTKQLSGNDNHVPIIIGLIILAIAIVCYYAFRHYTNCRTYKSNFEQLMSNINKDRTKQTTKPKKADILDIHPDAVASVLRQLEKFEKEHKYIAKDLTMGKLAASFDVNVTYLSKIISHYKEKKFADYINDLKVDYIITLLNTEKRTRNYTNKALAEEVGFSSTQRFATAFLARTGISVTYFIEQLKKGE